MPRLGVGGGVGLAAIVAIAERALTVLFVGSSTPEKYFSTFSGPSNARVTSSSNGTSFAAQGTTGQGATNLGNTLANALDLDVRFLKSGIGGTSLTQWEASPSTRRAPAVAMANAAGGVDAIVCGLGFNDARLDKSITSVAAHATKLRSFFSKLRTEIGLPNCPIFIIATQKYTEGDAIAAAQTGMVRSAELEVMSDPNVYLFGHTYDLAQMDGIHMADGEYTKHAARGAAQMLAVVNGTAQQRGPKFIGAAAVSDTETDVELQYVAGSDFTPTSGLTGFEISLDDFATTIPVTAAVRQSATGVRITHGTTGPDAVNADVRYMATGAPDVSGTAYANTAVPVPPDPTIFPLAFTTIPGGGGSTALNAQFTAANGTALSAYTADSGHTFTQGSGSHLLSDGAVYGATIPANALSSWIPDDAIYTVEFGVVQTSSLQGNTLARFRVQDDNNYWWAGLSQSGAGVVTWILGRTISGSATTYSSPAVTITLGQEYVCTVAVGAGGQHVLTVSDGSTVSRADDQTPLLPKGGVGLRASTAAQTATTGARITYLQANG